MGDSGRPLLARYFLAWTQAHARLNGQVAASLAMKAAFRGSGLEKTLGGKGLDKLASTGSTKAELENLQKEVAALKLAGSEKDRRITALAEMGASALPETLPDAAVILEKIKAELENGGTDAGAAERARANQIKAATAQLRSEMENFIKADKVTAESVAELQQKLQIQMGTAATHESLAKTRAALIEQGLAEDVDSETALWDLLPKSLANAPSIDSQRILELQKEAAAASEEARNAETAAEIAQKAIVDKPDKSVLALADERISVMRLRMKAAAQERDAAMLQAGLVAHEAAECKAEAVQLREEYAETSGCWARLRSSQLQNAATELRAELKAAAASDAMLRPHIRQLGEIARGAEAELEAANYAKMQADVRVEQYSQIAQGELSDERVRSEGKLRKLETDLALMQRKAKMATGAEEMMADRVKQELDRVKQELASTMVTEKQIARDDALWAESKANCLVLNARAELQEEKVRSEAVKISLACQYKTIAQMELEREKRAAQAMLVSELEAYQCQAQIVLKDAESRQAAAAEKALVQERQKAQALLASVQNQLQDNAKQELEEERKKVAQVSAEAQAESAKERQKTKQLLSLMEDRLSQALEEERCQSRALVASSESNEKVRAEKTLEALQAQLAVAMEQVKIAEKAEAQAQEQVLSIEMELKKRLGEQELAGTHARCQAETMESMLSLERVQSEATLARVEAELLVALRDVDNITQSEARAAQEARAAAAAIETEVKAAELKATEAKAAANDAVKNARQGASDAMNLLNDEVGGLWKELQRISRDMDVQGPPGISGGKAPSRPDAAPGMEDSKEDQTAGDVVSRILLSAARRSIAVESVQVPEQKKQADSPNKLDESFAEIGKLAGSVRGLREWAANLTPPAPTPSADSDELSSLPAREKCKSQTPEKYTKEEEERAKILQQKIEEKFSVAQQTLLGNAFSNSMGGAAFRLEGVSSSGSSMTAAATSSGGIADEQDKVSVTPPLLQPTPTPPLEGRRSLLLPSPGTTDRILQMAEAPTEVAIAAGVAASPPAAPPPSPERPKPDQGDNGATKDEAPLEKFEQILKGLQTRLDAGEPPSALRGELAQLALQASALAAVQKPGIDLPARLESLLGSIKILFAAVKAAPDEKPMGTVGVTREDEFAPLSSGRLVVENDSSPPGAHREDVKGIAPVSPTESSITADPAILRKYTEETIVGAMSPGRAPVDSDVPRKAEEIPVQIQNGPVIAPVPYIRIHAGAPQQRLSVVRTVIPAEAYQEPPGAPRHPQVIQTTSQYRTITQALPQQQTVVAVSSPTLPKTVGVAPASPEKKTLPEEEVLAQPAKPAKPAASRIEADAVANMLLLQRCMSVWAEFVRGRAAEWQIETLHQALVQAHASQKAAEVARSLAGQVLNTRSPLSSKVLGRAEAADHFLLTGVLTQWHNFVSKKGAFSPSPQPVLREVEDGADGEEERLKKEDEALELTKEELRREQERLAAIYNCRSPMPVIRMVHHPARAVAHSPQRARTQQFVPPIGNIPSATAATASVSSMATPGAHLRQRQFDPTQTSNLNYGLTVPQMAPRALPSTAGSDKRMGLPPPPVLGSSAAQGQLPPGQRLGSSASTGQLAPADPLHGPGLQTPMTPGTPLRWRPQDAAVSPQVQQRMPGLDPQQLMHTQRVVAGMPGVPGMMTAATPSPGASSQRCLLSPEGLTLPGAPGTTPTRNSTSPTRAVVRLPSNSPAVKQNPDAAKAS